MRRGLILAVLVIMGAGVAASQSLTEAFTYQGRLTDQGGPANGDYDFFFRLYLASVGGAQVGPSLFFDDFEVEGGLFTVTLDFGPGVFTGDRLWLEVAVRAGASTGGFTVLEPRQELTAAPQASFALGAAESLAAPWGGLSGVPPDFADGVDDVDDTVSWPEVSGIVGDGPQQLAEGEHRHPAPTTTDLNVDENGDIKLTADPFSPDTDVYHGRVTKLFLKDLPELLDELGGSGITLAQVNQNVKIVWLSVETYGERERQTFTGYRWARVTGAPAGVDETDIYWPVKVVEDTNEATEDTSGTHKLFRVNAFFY